MATNFPRLWGDPCTSDRQRKRMIRLMLEDVTMVRAEKITAHVRFRGGASRPLTLDLPLTAGELHKTAASVVTEVDRLLDHHTDGEIVAILNQRGLRPGRGSAFTDQIIAGIRQRYGLADRFTRLRRTGLLTVDETADLLRPCTATVRR